MNNLSERQRTPKVSIGLPVRNGEAYLEEALESLATQDYPNLELIVSDNGSTDATKEILAAAQARFPSIRVFTHTETLAATDNFMFVLEQASGEYFCWAADDDVRAPGSIGRLADTLENNPQLVCVMSDVVNLYEETGRRTVDRLEGIRLEKVIEDWPKVRRRFFEVPTSNVFFCVYGLYRTEVLRRIKMNMNLGFSANTEIPMLAQVALLGGIASIDEEGFFYRRHSKSIYHQEMASAPRGESRRRSSIIRKVLRGFILGSSIPLDEKRALITPLISAELNEWVVLNKTMATKAIKKSKSVMRRFSFRRTLRRLKNRFFGGAEEGVKMTAQKRAKRDRKNFEGRNGRRREAKAGKEVSTVNAAIDLESADIPKLLERELERSRLEASGWTFSRPKRLKLIDDRQITTILDCGANTGQYVDDLKKAGWAGKVFSFEPLSHAYEKLRTKAEASDRWRAFHFALGERNEESTIQIAGNSYSSSLLEFSNDFKELLPAASPVGTETVTIRRLDDVVNEEGIRFDGPVMLKLDVQGFELSVLRGAEATLKRISLIQCELALVTSYEGGATFSEVRDYLRERGFVLAHIIDGHASRETGELREVDGLFLNTKLEAGR